MNDEFKNAFIKTKAAGSIASGALDEVCSIIKPGIIARDSIASLYLCTFVLSCRYNNNNNNECL